MRRGQLLREIAMKRQGVISDADIAQMKSKQDFTSSLYDAATGFATSAATAYAGGVPGTEFDSYAPSSELRNNYSNEELIEMGVI